MLPSERLKGIEAFVASAELGSFTAAGRRLNLTNSAISKTVARLESRLACTLFHRTTRSLKLTDAGTAFYATCVRVLGDLAEAEAVLTAHGVEPVGRVKLDLPVAFGRMRVMPLLLRFADLYPAVRLQVSFTDRFVDVAGEGVDAAIRIGGPDAWPDGVGHRRLGAERLVFCAAPDYLARQPVPTTPDALVELGGVLYGRSDGVTSPWRFRSKTGVEHHAVEGRMILGSAEAQVEAVKAGVGVAQLATWLVSRELETGALVEVLPDYAVEGLPLTLVWLTDRQSSPKVAALLSLLGAELSAV